MKKILLITSFLPSFLFSQSLVFDYNIGNIQPVSAKHERLSNGQEISVLNSYYDFGNINTIIKKDSDGGINNQFNFTFGTYNSYDLLGVIPIENNEFIVGLNEFSGTYSLVRFASDNSVLWKKKYSISNYTGGYYKNVIINNGNNGVYIMVSDVNSLTILNINALGDLVWSKSFIGPQLSGKSPGFSICKTSDNGVLATLKDNSNQCILKINSFGNVEWSKSFMDFNYRWPISIRTTNDGNFIVAGNLNGEKPYFQKFTQSGELLFAKTFESGYHEVQDVKQHSNGNYYIIFNNILNLGVLEVDQNGNLIKTSIFSEILYNYYQSPKFNGSDSDLSFYCPVTDSQNQLFHSKIDLNDNLNPDCIPFQEENNKLVDDIAFQEATIFSDIIVNDIEVNVDDNVFITFLPEYTIQAEDFCEFRLSSEEIVPESKIEIFPNPTSDYLIINPNGGFVSQIQLIDLHGKHVQAQYFEKNGLLQMDVSGLSSGIYRLILIVDEVLQSEQIVVQN